MTVFAAIRGATTVEDDNLELVHGRTVELVQAVLDKNQLQVADLVSVLFTATDDISSSFPALGARDIDGMEAVPMLCARELDIDGAMPRCIRLLAHVCLPEARELVHPYLHGAASLRPDLAR